MTGGLLDNATQNALERQREHFDTVAPRYREARENGNHRYLKTLIWSAILGDLDRFRHRQIDVLEPMCGFAEGYDIARTFLSETLTYTGFDYSETVVETVRATRPELNVWQQDVSTFEPMSEFDVIMLIGGLHHVPAVAADVVQTLAAALRPGGVFINFEPSHGNPLFARIRDGIYRNNTLFDAETERAFPVDRLCSMFSDADLRPVKRRYPGLLSYVLYYNPDAFPYLNLGGKRLVDMAFALDRLFYANVIGKAFSFATLTIWERR